MRCARLRTLSLIGSHDTGLCPKRIGFLTKLFLRCVRRFVTVISIDVVGAYGDSPIESQTRAKPHTGVTEAGGPSVRRTEPCLFFRLSAYGENVSALIETDRLRIRPLVRKQALIARLPEGLLDVPCLRPRTNQWGIGFPVMSIKPCTYGSMHCLTI